jgi:uncharacterized membrane protein
MIRGPESWGRNGSADMTQENFSPEYPEQNTVGLIGFIVSVVGLVVTGGLLSPVGMIISLVGLSKPPRGFATAGVIIGLVGTLLMFLWVLVLVLVTSAVAFTVLLAVAIDTWGIMWIETGFDSYKMSEAIVAYEKDTGNLPTSVSDLTLEEGVLLDYWGNPYITQIDAADRSLSVRSMGEDGIVNTEDDQKLRMSFSITDGDFSWKNWEDSKIEIGDDAED